MINFDINDDVVSLLLILLVVVTVNNSRHRHRLTRSALLHPILSPWVQLLRNADDGSFLSCFWPEMEYNLKFKIISHKS